MNKIKSRIGRLGRLLARRSTLLACLLAGIVMAGCSDDLGQGMGHDDMGKKVYGKLSVNLGSESPVTVQSRSGYLNFNENAQIKIDSYWLGLFDTKTGELIGSKYDIEPRKPNGGTRYTLYNGDGTPFTVEDVDIYYYDQHPEAYIVGVINFNGVLGKMAGDVGTTPLLELLTSAEKFEDICRISVDTESANRANPLESSSGYQETPLMMGFYTTNWPSSHLTVNNGGVSQNDAQIRLVRTGDNYSEMSLPEGSIKLQRLISEIVVNVSGSDAVKIKSVSYTVVHNPTEVYLAEHAVDMAGSIRTTKADYDANTANSADMVENGYNSYGGFSRAYQTGENSFRFSYQEYENKHWGRTRSYPNGLDEYSHYVREEKYDNTGDTENDVFKSLCNDVNKPYNNNASYMILKVDFDAFDFKIFGDDMDFQGTAYYTIHEGRVKSGFDYERTRNTRYTYDIAINGIEELAYQVNSVTWGGPDEGHNDGLSGEIWMTKIFPDDMFKDFSVSYEDGYVAGYFGIPKGFTSDITFRFLEEKSNGEVNNYGNYSPIPGAPDGFPNWTPIYGQMQSLGDCPFLEDFLIQVLDPYYDSPIGEPMTVTEFYKYDFSTYPNDIINICFLLQHYSPDDSAPDQYNRTYFICLNNKFSDADGCTMAPFVYGFEKKPVDTRGQLSRPGYVPCHHPGPLYSTSIHWCGALETVTYICWSPSGPVEKYVLQIDNNEPIDVDPYAYTNAGPGVINVVHYPLTDYSNIYPGLHTVTIRTVVDESRFKPVEPVVYEDGLLIIGEPYWDFTRMPFLDWLKPGAQYDSSNDTYTTTANSVEYGGLTLMIGSKGMTFRTSGDVPYIQTNGSGGTNSRSFKVTVSQPGTFRVYASTPNSSYTEGRYLVLNQGEEGEVDTKEVTVPNTEKYTYYELETEDVDEPTEMSIYTTGNLRIYAIQFTPRGRVPVVPLPPVVP